MEIHHTAIQVGDIDRTKAFYEDGLGLEFAWEFHTDDGVHNYYVTGDELDTWLQFVHDPESTGDPEPAGIGHLAIHVDDVDATVEKLTERTDCPVVAEPATYDVADARAAFVEDPDGYEVEIFRKESVARSSQ